LTLIPSARVCVMAGRPSRVAGILMKMFGRSTSAHSSRAWLIVPSVSRARRGSTSIDTRPSTPPVAWCTSLKTSAAARTSSVVIVVTASSRPTPAAASSPSWAS